jgi:hypothetical protein
VCLLLIPSVRWFVCLFFAVVVVVVIVVVAQCNFVLVAQYSVYVCVCVWRGFSSLRNTDLDHLNGLDGVVVPSPDPTDFLHQIVPLRHLAKDWVRTG